MTPIFIGLATILLGFLIGFGPLAIIIGIGACIFISLMYAGSTTIPQREDPLAKGLELLENFPNE